MYFARDISLEGHKSCFKEYASLSHEVFQFSFTLTGLEAFADQILLILLFLILPYIDPDDPRVHSDGLKFEPIQRTYLCIIKV